MIAGLVSSIPSPSHGEVHLGPLPLRGYALCIILGVVAAVIIGERRFRRMGYPAGVVSDIAIWAVPFGLVGARLYHVITDNQLYFRSGEDHWRALAIWDGGLGIWGAIALGAVGALIGCRQHHVRFAHLADAMAVGIPVAQAIGRWGNWFNQELYGRATSLPWGLRIDAAHSVTGVAATYQPTFLYESIWDLLTAGFVVLAERTRWFGRLSAGRAFALYVAAYCVGRGWIEYLRVDEAHRYLGLRLNDYTSLVLFLLAVGYLVRVRGRGPDTATGLAGEDVARQPSGVRVVVAGGEHAAVPEGATTYDVEPRGEPTPEPTPEPIGEPTPEPIGEPTPEPIAEPIPEPIGEPRREPIVEPTPDTLADPIPKAVPEPVGEPLSPIDRLRQGPVRR